MRRSRQLTLLHGGIEGDNGTRGRNMLYQHGNDQKRALLAQAGQYGIGYGIGHGIQRVTQNPSFKAKPAPGAQPNHAAPTDKSDDALPDPEWNKDIRAYYEAVVEEPVPQEFVDLLQQIANDISD